jgi:hypothetical protein
MAREVCKQLSLPLHAPLRQKTAVNREYSFQMGGSPLDRGVQNEHCAIRMTRSGVRIENHEDVCMVNDPELHTGDDLWGASYYNHTRRIDGRKFPDNVLMSEIMLHRNIDE